MESPYKEILIFVFGGGLITALITASKEIRERVAEKKKQKSAEAEAHRSNAVESQRLENESDDAAWQRLKAMLETSQREEQRLREELIAARNTSSLSGTTVTAMYRAYRELGTKISKVELLMCRETYSELQPAVDDLKKKYDELGEKMP